jgi:hypothetical protein
LIGEPVGVCPSIGSGTEEALAQKRLWHRRDGADGSAEQDPLSEQRETDPSVHLPLQELELPL